MFDFNKDYCRRDSESEKWNLYDQDVLPMWVADSDYAVCPDITQSLQKRLEHPIFGYGDEPKHFRELIVKRMQSHYQWEIQSDWICFIPGVVAGLNMARAITGQSGSESITAIPTYPHLHTGSPILGQTMQYFSMKLENGRYTPDFDELDQKINNKTTLLLLSNPHNPVGTIYTEKELNEYAKRAIDHDLVICSDEIHADFILDQSRVHQPIAALSKEIEKRTITLMAASKTFNIAGLNCAYAIISDPHLRTQFKTQLKGLVGGVNVLGYIASTAAYESGENWLSEQLVHLRKNANYCYEQINQIEGLSMTQLEATYLAWIDARELLNKIGQDKQSAYEFFLGHGIALSDGAGFKGAGFVRMNLATSFDNVCLAISRIKQAVKSI